jgi:hypothetical protein
MLARVPIPRLRAFLLVLAVALLYPYFSSFAIWLGVPYPTGPWLNIRIIIGILFQLTILALLALVLTRQKRTWQSLGVYFSWENVLHSLGLVIVAYLGYYLVYVLAWYLSATITGHPIAVQSNNVSFLREGNFLLLLIYGLSNPWFEEVIVRAYTMTELAAFKLPEGSIVLVSVLLQTGYHLYQGVPAALLISSQFFIFAVYYANTRRALPVILAHLYLDLFALMAYR